MIGSFFQSYAYNYNVTSIHAAFEGAGTEDDPFLIPDEEMMLLFRNIINTYPEISYGLHYKLTNDLRFNTQVLNDEGTLIEDIESLSQWTPIGSYNWYNRDFAFMGVFDGDGHSISGLYSTGSYSKDTDIEKESHALFAYVYNGTIKNLTIKDSYFSSCGLCGSIAGMVRGGSSNGDLCVLDNCKSYATVYGFGPMHATGGISGEISGYYGTAQVTGCEFWGRVISESFPNDWGDRWNCSVGGLAGNVSGGRIRECANHGYVEMMSWAVCGGLAGSLSGGGSVSYSENSGTVVTSYDKGADIGGIVGSNSGGIYNCVNSGQVLNGCSEDCLGGIAGSSYWKSTISDCVNKADINIIHDNTKAGGICGNAFANNSYPNYGNEITINNCRNEGTISASSSSLVGGITGNTNYATISDCTNLGHIIGSTRYAGGISANLEYHSSITRCTNEGTVKGMSDIGGIVGCATGPVNSCINHGLIEAMADQEDYSCTGGVVGSQSNGALVNCYNTARVISQNYAGGIAGKNSYSHTQIINCYNSGDVESVRDYSTGGIIGMSVTAIFCCYNTGCVTNLNNGNTGGIVGTMSGSSITNCYNAGMVTSTGFDQSAGTIAGWINERTSTTRTDKLFTLKDCLKAEGNVNGDWWWSAVKGPTEISMEYLASDSFLNAINEHASYIDYMEGNQYVKGLYRPMLKAFYQEGLPGYVDAMTLTGDSVKVDFGLPFGNDVLTTDNGQLMKYGYNTVDSALNAVRQMCLSEDFEYSLPTDVDALSLKMCIKMPVASESFVVDSYKAMVLPFDLDYIGENVKFGVLDEVTESEAVFGHNETIYHGTPFIIVSDCDRFCIDKGNVKLYGAEHLSENGLVGSFSYRSLKSNDGYSYFSLRPDGVWERHAEIVINPFQAVLKTDIDSDVLVTSFSKSSVVDVADDSENVRNKVYTIDGRYLGCMTMEELRRCKSGIYIFGNRKYYIK